MQLKLPTRLLRLHQHLLSIQSHKMQTTFLHSKDIHTLASSHSSSTPFIVSILVHTSHIRFSSFLCQMSFLHLLMHKPFKHSLLSSFSYSSQHFFSCSSHIYNPYIFLRCLISVAVKCHIYCLSCILLEMFQSLHYIQSPLCCCHISHLNPN